MRAAWSDWPFMTINNVYVLAGGRPATQVVLADRSEAAALGDSQDWLSLAGGSAPDPRGEFPRP
jgi:hypothetical protein